MSEIQKSASHPDVPRPSNAELIALALKVCHAIEACGASPELTNAVMLASDLHTYLRKPEHLSEGIGDVLAERRRQVDSEGWTQEHDDAHDGGQMASAAACYAAFTAAYPAGDPPSFWPWDSQWWKPKDRRSNLVRAAALILAEIDRLDRSAAI